MTVRRPGNGSRFAVALVALCAAISTLVVPAIATATAAGAATLPRPKGAGPPVAASGMGTSAALDNPLCRKESPQGDPLLSGYGRFDSTVVGGGPVCVKAWKEGADNGGATWQGVTKDKITVIAVLPNDTQLETDPVKPKNKADKSPSTYENAIHDMLIPQLKYFETWGRDLEVKFVTSSGSDEAAQRADAVAIKSMKPFAVFDLIVAGLDVLETELAKAKIPNFGFSATAKKSNLQAPYRWGPSDAQSSAINSAEVIGKQLVGKKAEFAGDDVSGQTRKFGVVYIPTLVDIDDFKSYFKKYGGTIASENSYPANGSTFGTASVSEEQAPTMVTRMKAAGVTTVIMLSDFSMNKALMDNATRQEWFPEWFFTGAIYADIGILARAYPAEQSTHAFGLSFLTPFTELDPPPPPPQLPLSTLTDPLNWYWGVDAGTQAGAVSPELDLVAERHPRRGAEPHPEDAPARAVRDPGRRGAPPRTVRTAPSTGSARCPNLPYDEYAQNGVDFAPYWWDPTTTGPSNGQGEMGKGVGWYANGAKRYIAGTWPKKQFDWFDKDTSVYHFETRQTPAPTYVGPCQGCPSTGGPARPARRATAASSPKPTARAKPRSSHPATPDVPSAVICADGEHQRARRRRCGGIRPGEDRADRGRSARHLRGARRQGQPAGAACCAHEASGPMPRSRPCSATVRNGWRSRWRARGSEHGWCRLRGGRRPTSSTTSSATRVRCCSSASPARVPTTSGPRSTSVTSTNRRSPSSRTRRSRARPHPTTSRHASTPRARPADPRRSSVPPAPGPGRTARVRTPRSSTSGASRVPTR